MGTKISALTHGTTPNGTEKIPVVQSGSTVYLTAAEIASLYTPATSTVTALTVSSGVVDIDLSLGDYFALAPTANITSITFSNLPGSGKGASKFIRFTQDSTPRTVAWPSSFQWDSGTADSVSTAFGAIDLIAITTFDNGTKWQITLSKGRA